MGGDGLVLKGSGLGCRHVGFGFSGSIPPTSQIGSGL
jgi:hypothetical protein